MPMHPFHFFYVIHLIWVIKEAHWENAISAHQNSSNFCRKAYRERKPLHYYHIKVFSFNSNTAPTSHKMMPLRIRVFIHILLFSTENILCTFKKAFLFHKFRDISQLAEIFFPLVGNSAKLLKEFRPQLWKAQQPSAE